MESKKKICLVIHSLGIGGMERVMSILANSFVEQHGAEVSLVLIGRKREVLQPLNPLVKVHRPDFKFDNSRRIIHSLKTMWFLRKKVYEINPETVLSFGEYWNNLVLLSLVRTPFPVYISDRSEPNKNLGMWQNLLRKKLYPKAKGYIAQTKKAADIAFLNHWNTNVHIIGNPIREIKEYPGLQKEKIILSVGRIIPTKHFDQLIDIFASLKYQDWKLCIVGGNAKNMSLLEKLREKVIEQQLQNQVILAGEQGEVDQYYRSSSIFAFTSSSEGFPNVVGEAIQAGLPVVGFDSVAGNTDLIKDGENGYLVPIFDKKEFGNKLKFLIQNEARRLEQTKRGHEIIKSFQAASIANFYFHFITGNRKL